MARGITRRRCDPSIASLDSPGLGDVKFIGATTSARRSHQEENE
jgi:hypothetical protein